MFSDGHNILRLTLDIKFKITDNQPKESYDDCKITNPKWKDTKSTEFTQNINAQKIEETISYLSNIDVNNAENLINLATNSISEIFNESAHKTFGKRAKINKNTNNKPWFGPVCQNARILYNKAKKKYQINKTELNKINLTQTS